MISRVYPPARSRASSPGDLSDLSDRGQPKLSPKPHYLDLGGGYYSFVQIGE
jgi:hypothetical protein